MTPNPLNVVRGNQMSEYYKNLILGGVIAAIVGTLIVVGVAHIPLGNTTTNSTITTSVSRNYVAGTCPTVNQTYPNTATPWTMSTINKTVFITKLNVEWLGPASDLNGNTTQPSQNLSLKAGEVLFYSVGWSAQPFNYKIDSVYTNTSNFYVVGICYITIKSYMVQLPQGVPEGTNFGFDILLQLPTNSSYTGSVNVYIQTGQETPGCTQGPCF
jgi:hypothetical protein